MTQKRPQKGDYDLFFANYIDLVPSGDLLEILQQQRREMTRLLSPFSDQQAEFRYGPGKWSIKEVVGHISDAERIFAYRLLRIARRDKTPLASFDQDSYIEAGNFSARKLPDLLQEYTVIREATIILIRSLDDAAWSRRGVASQKEITVSALAYIIAGHERHHRIILEDRYLPALGRG